MQRKPCNLNTMIRPGVPCNIYIISIGKYILIDHNRHHQVLLLRFSGNHTLGTLDQNQHFVCFESLRIFFSLWTQGHQMFRQGLAMALGALVSLHWSIWSFFFFFFLSFSVNNKNTIKLNTLCKNWSPHIVSLFCLCLLFPDQPWLIFCVYCLLCCTNQAFKNHIQPELRPGSRPHPTSHDMHMRTPLSFVRMQFFCEGPRSLWAVAFLYAPSRATSAKKKWSLSISEKSKVSLDSLPFLTAGNHEGLWCRAQQRGRGFGDACTGLNILAE
jgi:hypothetical protein